MSSRTLIIDIQWHKKDIIPRYNKYPYSQFRFATTTGHCPQDEYFIHQLVGGQGGQRKQRHNV